MRSKRTNTSCHGTCHCVPQMKTVASAFINKPRVQEQGGHTAVDKDKEGWGEADQFPDKHQKDYSVTPHQLVPT